MEGVFSFSIHGGVLPALYDIGHIEDVGSSSFSLLTLLSPGDSAGWVPTQEDALLPIHQPQGPVGLKPVDAEAVPAQGGGQAVLVGRVLWQKGTFYYQRLGRVLDGDVGRVVLVDGRALLGLVSVPTEAEILLPVATGSHPCIVQAHGDSGSAQGQPAPAHAAALQQLSHVALSTPVIPNLSYGLWDTSHVPSVTAMLQGSTRAPQARGAPVFQGHPLPSATTHISRH